ncbi:MAG: flagellar basal body protein [Candidatus Sumerlaeota bacterium]|nr:flagellar basal body protein [Candidatus Sumerlaeota bacterium]
MSIGSIMNIARQSFFAQQTALQVTAQNIANANTEGYSRQRAAFQASPYGDGVSIQSIERLHDQFLDRQVRDALSAQGSLNQMSLSLARLEAMFDETQGQGVGTGLNDLFAAFQDLASRPAGTAERGMVRSKAESLASLLNDNSRQLEQTQRDSGIRRSRNWRRSSKSKRSRTPRAG